MEGKRKQLFSEIILFIVVAGMVALLPLSAAGFDITMGDKKVSLMGYLNQSVCYGIGGDRYDTQEGFQQAIFQGLVEARLKWNRDLRFFVSGKLNADWAYPILHNDSDWNDKQFDKSKSRLQVFSHGRDIIHEAHATWTPGNWFLRLGKQIVVWGETDGFRLMDQINPLDQRRGITDVEFETTIIPIWLMRLEYFLHPDAAWITDLGLEFIFNPNFDFRGDELIETGNDKAGIWAPNVEIPFGGPYPNDYAHLGSQRLYKDEPDAFMDSDGFEYGFRIKGIVWDSIVTLNAFYGRENIRATKGAPAPPDMEGSEFDNRLILHPSTIVKYPLQRFVGFTFARDFEDLYISALGGIAPVLRLEAFYAFNNTYTENPQTPMESFEKFDEIRYAVGIDWRVKLRFLNPRDAFMISPQFYHRKIRDYPSGKLTQNGQALRDDNYQASLMVNTTYFHNKIIPVFFWLRDISEEADWYKIQVSYERSDVWNYALGVNIFDGSKPGRGFEVFDHKDHWFFTVSYRFS